MIKLKGIRKTYGRDDYLVNAIDGLDLEIQDGEFVAIMGRSGCGKTSLLNVLGTVDRDYEGKYLLDDTDMRSLSEKNACQKRQSDIAIIYQNYNIIEELSVYNNVIFTAYLAGKKGDKERVKEILDELGLAKKLTQSAACLSGGEKQRLAIARSLYQDAGYILADEPTGNLDYNNGINVMKIFEKIHSTTGKTIIMVTHDEEMAGYADRIVRMKDGKIVGEG